MSIFKVTHGSTSCHQRLVHIQAYRCRRRNLDCFCNHEHMQPVQFHIHQCLKHIKYNNSELIDLAGQILIIESGRMEKV